MSLDALSALAAVVAAMAATMVIATEAPQRVREIEIETGMRVGRETVGAKTTAGIATETGSVI